MAAASSPGFTVSILIAIFLVFTPAPSAFADCGDDSNCTDVSDWGRYTHIRLQQSTGGTGDAVEWVASFDHERSDFSIEIDSRGERQEQGTIAMVGGRVMLSRDLDLDPGSEIDSLDVPVLSIRLVMILLTRVFPEGPDQVVGRQAIDHVGEHGIRLATPSAGGFIPAPWKLAGEVEKLGDGSIRFDLSFSAAGETPSSGFQAQLEGEFGMREGPVFLDSDTLERWKVYGVGPQKREQDGATILDYGARGDDRSGYRTIADIRAAIAALDHPGTRDENRNFTGFWKQDCAEGFGLQIKPNGDDGKYSIVFCGPGGCGDPADSRATFITGDPHYEVVSEDEIVTIGSSGDRSTYHRCTRDPHPLL